MEVAFSANYDPTVVLKSGRARKKAPASDNASEPKLSSDDPQTTTLRRKEQDILDHIVHGNDSSHYYLVLGPKVRLTRNDFYMLYLRKTPGVWKRCHDF